MFAHACELGLEGVASKVCDSVYASGRGHNWVKKTCATLTAFTLLLPRGLLSRPFNIAALLCPFVGERGLSLGSLVDRARGRLLRLWAFRLGFR